MQSTRHRTPFPLRPSPPPSPPATPLDELQQETLITTLSSQNTSQNTLYTLALLVLLLLSALFPLLTFLSQPLTSLLSLSCLAAEGYSLLLPLAGESEGGNGNAGRAGGGLAGPGAGAGRFGGALGRGRRKGKKAVRSRWDEIVAWVEERVEDVGTGGGLAEKWVPIGGMGLGALLAVDGLVVLRSGGVEQVGRGFGLLVPGVTGVVVWAGRRWMGGVDVRGLERLRYELKGA